MHFYICDDGDDSVGISGNHATLVTDVDIFGPEDRQGYIDHIKESLIAAFSAIWSNSRVHVAALKEGGGEP